MTLFSPDDRGYAQWWYPRVSEIMVHERAYRSFDFSSVWCFFVLTKILVICEKVSWRPWSPSTGQEMVRKEKIADGQRTVWQRKLEGARTSTNVAVKIRCKTEFRFSSFLSIYCGVIGWKFINYLCTIKIRKITKELNPAVYFVMVNLIEGHLK